MSIHLKYLNFKIRFRPTNTLGRSCFKEWRKLWLECDFQLVISSFKPPRIVSHIYREGNH